jgi:hypothetical protein
MSFTVTPPSNGLEPLEPPDPPDPPEPAVPPVAAGSSGVAAQPELAARRTTPRVRSRMSKLMA